MCRNSKRALGFCTSRKHAEYMAKYFCENGILSVAVYSGDNGEYSANRTDALSKLTKGEEGALIALQDDIRECICDESFKGHMKDAIEVRVERYYEERNCVQATPGGCLDNNREAL